LIVAAVRKRVWVKPFDINKNWGVNELAALGLKQVLRLARSAWAAMEDRSTLASAR
jgi:hypothetical protein